MITKIFERNAELLKTADISHGDWDNLLLLNSLGLFFEQNFILIELMLDCLMTDQFGDLDLTSQKDLKSLDLRSLAPVFQEVFHTTIKRCFQEFFKALRNAELFVGVGQKTNIDDRE